MPSTRSSPRQSPLGGEGEEEGGERAWIQMWAFVKEWAQFFLGGR
jgi:hypothetical protein